MFVLPGTTPDFAKRITREAAERVAGNWSLILLNGLVLIVAGVLILSIDWSLRSLATFIGALFIAQGVVEALTTGFDARVRRANVLTGLLSIAAGIAIIVWPSPGVTVVAIFLGAWLIVTGMLAMTAAFAVRPVYPDWWLLLVVGLIEVGGAVVRDQAPAADHRGVVHALRGTGWLVAGTAPRSQLNRRRLRK
jgi:uncharacterized membrane protein HdeD (DUF308 family)